MIAYLDSNIFIYALNDAGAAGRHSVDLLERIARGDHLGVSSALSIIEVIAKPWSVSAEAGQQAQLAMEGMPGVDYVTLSTEVAIVAAQLRGAHWGKLGLPDSVHIATALVARANIMVTNDKALTKLAVKSLEIRLLGEPLT